MRALLLKGPGNPFSIETVNDPTPEKGYAVARVLACGSGSVSYTHLTLPTILSV